MDLEIRKEAFDRLVEGNVMSRELVVLEVILKIGGYEPAPVSHEFILQSSPFYEKVICVFDSLTREL